MSQDVKKLNKMISERKAGKESETKKVKEFERERTVAIEKRREREATFLSEKFAEKDMERQKKASRLIRELLAVCEEDTTPAFVFPMAKVLDSNQGIFFPYKCVPLSYLQNICIQVPSTNCPATQKPSMKSSFKSQIKYVV